MCAVKFDDHTMEDFIKVSTKVMNEYGYFTQCLWHVDDVHLLCQQRGWPALSHEEARGVFGIFAELYDGDQGMTWSKLEQATQVYIAQKGKLDDMRAPRFMSAESIEGLIEDAPMPYLIEDCKK